MASVFVHMRVNDFSEWKKMFDENAGFRADNGVVSNQIYTDADDANMVFILFKWNSLANARKFMQSPELRSLMQKAGVEGQPHFHFMNEE